MSEQSIITAINSGFNDVHKRLDRFAEIQNEHNTKIALLEAKLPMQPCGFFERHVENHPDKHDLQRLLDEANKNKEDMRSVIIDFIKGAAKLTFAAVMGALGYKVFGGQ